MSDFEVPEAIICSPFDEPTHHWHLEAGAEPDKRPGRRPAVYFYPDPPSPDGGSTGAGIVKLRKICMIDLQDIVVDALRGPR